MPSLTLELGSDSNVGRVRAHNEDAWETVTYSGGELCIVCDGMGGHEAGDLASAIAIRTIAGTVVAGGLGDPREQLFRALERAHEEVLAAAATGTGRPGMGTTAVVALARGGALFLGHVGDSRAYLIRDGLPAQLTRDQTKVQDLIEGGHLDERDAKQHPEAGVLAQAIGMPRGLLPFVTPEETGIPLRAGDAVLLCSDGVYDAFEPAEIAQFVAGRSAAEAARVLVTAAVERDGQDNATAVVAVVHEAVMPRRVAPTVIDGDDRNSRRGWRRSLSMLGAGRPGTMGTRPWSPFAWAALALTLTALGFLAGRVTAARPPPATGGDVDPGRGRATTLPATSTSPD